MHALSRWSLAALMAVTAVGAHALDYKSIGPAPAVLYDAPSEKGRRVFIAPRNMPVEVVLTYGTWTKVRDASGDLAWVESRLLSPRRHLIVVAPSAKIRAGTDDASAVIFTADRGVLLELAEPVASGWLRVRHRDGQGGYVRSSEVWGD